MHYKINKPTKSGCDVHVYPREIKKAACRIYYMCHQLKMSKEEMHMNPKKSTIGAKPNRKKCLSLIAI